MLVTPADDPSGGMIDPLRMVSLLGIAILIAVRAAAAQGTTLVVSVADAADGAPIADAQVVIADLERYARTNWIGEAHFSGLPAGTHQVMVRRLGYALSDLRVPMRGDSAGVVFMLQRIPADLDTVHVLAERERIQAHREFDYRRHKGLGRFLDEAGLAKEGTREFPLVAISHFPGLRLISGRAGQLELAAQSGSCGVDTSFELLNPTRQLGQVAQVTQVVGEGSGARQTSAQTPAASGAGSCFSSHPCYVKLFLDNVPVAETDINIVRTEQLYGAEYYSIGHAPPQYRVSGAACGVLLLWTKAWDGT